TGDPDQDDSGHGPVRSRRLHDGRSPRGATNSDNSTAAIVVVAMARRVAASTGVIPAVSVVAAVWPPRANPFESHSNLDAAGRDPSECRVSALCHVDNTPSARLLECSGGAGGTAGALWDVPEPRCRAAGLSGLRRNA